MTESNRRKFTRIQLEVEIKLAEGKQVLPATGHRDISLGGAFITMDEPPPVGTRCTIAIRLLGPSSMLRVELEGEVLRIEEEGMAIEFTKVDLDSLVHLRHLIKVHTEFPEVIDEEFVNNLIKMEDSIPPTS